jgi:ATP-binding cassette subfamily C protein
MSREQMKLFDLFKNHGTAISASANTFISLQDEPALFFIAKGSANVFSIQLKGGQPEGPRTLLTTQFERSLLFYIEKDYTFPEHGIYAITETDTVLWKLSLATFQAELAKDQDPCPFFCIELENWIIRLSSFVKPYESKHKEFFISKCKEYAFEEETIYTIKRSHTSSEKQHLLWLEILNGKATFFRSPNVCLIPGSPLFPLRDKFCLLSEDPLKLKLYTTQEILKKCNWVECLSFFHKTLFHFFLLYTEDKAKRLITKLKEKQEEEEQTLNSVFKTMISLLNPEDIATITPSTDPLFQACQYLGKILNITFSLPEELASHTDASMQIAAICEASNVKYRQVRLSKNWWKEDSGPLLAFFGAEQTPVVLVHKRGFYEMVNPITEKKKIISKRNSDQIIKLGFAFFRPFPTQLKSAKEILIFYLQSNYKELYPIIFYSCIGSMISLFVPYATAQIFNRAIPDSNLHILLQLCVGLFITAISSSVFLYIRTLGLVRMSGLASNQIQSAIWDRLLKLPVSFFRQYTTGNLVSKVISFDQVRQILSDNSSRIVLSGIFSLFYLIAMFLYSPILSIMSVILMGLTITITVLAFSYRLRFQNQVQKLSSIINGVLVQIISGVGKLRVSGAENNAFSYWAKLFIHFKRNELTSQTIQNVISSMVSFLPIFSYLLIFGTVMMLKAAGDISIGAFLGFNAAFIIFSNSIFDLCNALMQMVNIPPLWNNVRDIIEAPQEEIVEKIKVGKLSGNITIDEVSFRYDPEGPLILDKVTLHIESKDFVAIVGPSGCGKSTLVRHLLGFEKPTMGTIYYEGKDLNSLNLHKVRRQIGVVLQGGGIIAGTIYDNLVSGGVYSKKEVDTCLALSGFAEDLSTFPMGLHTFIPMGGETLSGGQKQRLLIARAILPKPKILIFDEATSALDNTVQEEISKNIDALDVTRIVIAHRLSTIKNADLIYVLSQGKIVQTGSFEKLTEEPGLFQEMLIRQQL